MRRIEADNPGIAVILCSTHDPKDLSAAAIQELWNARQSGTFVSV